MGSVIAPVVAALLTFAAAAAQAEDSKYPDFSGPWFRAYAGNPRYDPSKPIRKQQAPLKPEYQALFEASMKDQDEGGQGLDRGYSCLPPGMPRMMSGVSRFEILISPPVTRILFERTEYTPRRIWTDGRDWPKTEETWFAGYSIGKWIDTDGDGRYDTLEAETRRLRAPRVWDQSGMPMADDNDGIIRERIYLDKNDPATLRVDMTTIDNSLTRPWSVNKTFKKQNRVWWTEDNCEEGQTWVTIGKEVYYLSGDGTIMPTKKGQPPPDLKYFNQAKK